ncbi:TPA: hypothetical protein N2993_005423 [Klebsiella pneumoniae]|uniref:hypothetical protein n=1 Tax=Klebsiella pneumoniae TaxID=573 RepID=UPI0027307AEC|nr:hypothetical protein [Klebsiella pneumoniae]MDP0697864.1 hypothetical protein [Klebsiella pneumoniae]HCC6819947.1 hypothetical protein [Klebsiella pneumoniae]HCM1741624.1 hypothetical protein [Klebsiella pneumoniae]
MSSAASWSYTAKATIWRNLGVDEYGDSLGFSPPEVILCDYEGGVSKRIGGIGAEIVAKNTIWTEYAIAKNGDYILIGESASSDPYSVDADEVRQVIRFADTFERIADDFAILTGV